MTQEEYARRAEAVKGRLCLGGETAAVAAMRKLAETITAKRAAMAGVDCSLEEDLLTRITELAKALWSGCTALEEALEAVPTGSVEEEMRYCRRTVFAGMEKVRAAADALEIITPARLWPYPSYRELLFSI